MDTVQVPLGDGGVRLQVHQWGTGVPVVMVPSLGRGATDFVTLGESLAAEGFRALGVNLRGIEGSTGPLEGLDLHALASDVAGVIESIAEQPVHAIGHAFGNGVVRCLAADRPDLVRSVVLLAAGGLVPDNPPVGPEFGRCFQLDLPAEERVQAIQEAFFAPGRDAAVWLEGWWPEAHKAHLAAMQATPRDHWWEAGVAPLLIIQGLNDRLAPPANGHVLRLTAGKRVEVVDLPGLGHAMLPEQPEAIAALVIAFMKRKPATTG